MFRQKAGTASFGHGNVNQRHNRTAQIENSHLVGGTERGLGMIGHSRTSSTSSTGRQKGSRPPRKTQYCDSAGRSSSGPMASSISAVSASGGSGASWNSSLSMFDQAKRRTARKSSSRVNGLVT